MFFVVNNVCASCSHVCYIGFYDQSVPYLEIKYYAMLINGLRVPAYHIVMPASPSEQSWTRNRMCVLSCPQAVPYLFVTQV